jgi:peptide/nickel transport system substrate-binding protein
MKTRFLPFAAAAAAALAFSTMAQPSFAATECTRVIGYEPWTPQTTIDPAYNVTQTDVMYVMALFEPLAWVDSNFGLEPRLATSWEPNADGSVWTFHLREGVKFHDGSDFDAEDVVFTYKRMLDPASASPAADVMPFLTPDSVEVVDKHTVRFTASEPVVELPFRISNKFALILSSGDSTEDIKANANGTGPFMLDEFSPAAVRATLKANPDYWRAGLPKSDCIEISAIGESVARAAAVMGGEADVLLAVDASTVLSVGDDAEVEILQTEAGPLMMMWMMGDVAPYDDVRVRQALKLVIDRQKLVDVALLGFGSIGNDNPVPPSSPEAYRSDPIPQDIDKAKALLADAGYGDGLDIDLFIGATALYPGLDIMAQAYKEMAAQAGIEVNLVPAPVDSYWDEIWMKKPFSQLYFSLRPASTGLTIAYTSDAPYNGIHWFDDAFDKLVADAGKTLDKDKRRGLYQQAQRMLAEESGLILPAFSAVVSMVRNGCSGFQPHVEVNRVQYENIVCN